MSDRTDDLIETLVRAREADMSRDECAAIIGDVWSAPWERPIRDNCTMTGPRDLPDVRDRRIPYDEDGDGDRDLPLSRDESAFHVDEDGRENEDEAEL